MATGPKVQDGGSCVGGHRCNRKSTIIAIVLAKVTVILWLSSPVLETYYQKVTGFEPELESYRLLQQEDKSTRLSLVSSQRGSKTCPDLLSGMTKGRWVTGKITEQELGKMNAYLREVRTEKNIIHNVQREDGRCGNVSLPHKLATNKKNPFRAPCNPMGRTPCCRDNRCIPDESRDQCRCPGCYNERTAIYAEFSKWQTENAACQPLHYSNTTRHACKLLRGSIIYFIGASYISQVKNALASILVEDSEFMFGGQKDEHIKCLGWNQVGKACRSTLGRIGSFCGGTVQLTRMLVTHSHHLPRVLSKIYSNIQQRKFMVVIHVGIHDNYYIERTVHVFLRPFFNVFHWLTRHPSSIQPVMQAVKSFPSDYITGENPLAGVLNTSYPAVDCTNMEAAIARTDALKQRQSAAGNTSTPDLKSPSAVNGTVADHLSLTRGPPSRPVGFPNVLWLGSHHPGFIKSLGYTRQQGPGVKEFNKALFQELDRWGVPYVDTFQFTKQGVVSYDGTHYGSGINMLKANMMLTYIQRILKPDIWED